MQWKDIHSLSRGAYGTYPTAIIPNVGTPGVDVYYGTLVRKVDL